MSKRQAFGQGGEDRYGGYSHAGGPDMDGSEPAQKATAAQLAKRKIASLKGRPKARSASPMVNSNTFNPNPTPDVGGGNAFSFGGGGGGFGGGAGAGGNTSFTFGQGQGQQNGFGGSGFQFGQSQQSTPEPSNPFSGFGQQQQQNGTAQSNPFGGFGQQKPQAGEAVTGFKIDFSQASAPAQQNGVTAAPANPFNFGGQQQAAPPQQNGAATNGTASSNIFNFGQQAQQPQQNGAAQNGGMFGQQPQQNGAAHSTSFGGFGQPKQAEAQPASTFSFGQQPTPAPSNPFSSFGQQDQQKQPAQQNGGASTNVFGGFGQQSTQAAQANGTPAPSNPFANFGQTQTTQPESSKNSQTPAFGGIGQSQLFGTPAPAADSDMSKAPSEAAPAAGQSLLSKHTETPQPQSSLFSKPAETPKPAASNLFGGSGTGQSLFSKPAETPKPASSNLFTPSASQSLFSKPAETPKPASSNLFTSAANKSATDTPAEAPKMDGWSSFKSGSPSAAAASTTPAASGGDSVFSGWQQQQATKSFTPFTASQAVQPDEVDDDDAMESRKKSVKPSSLGASTLFGGAAATPKPASGGDLFSRISKPDAPEPTSQEPSATPAAPALGRSLFDRVTYPDTSKDQPQVSQTPAPKPSNAFGGWKPQEPPATVPPKNLFGGMFGASAKPAPALAPAASKSPEKTAAPQISLFTKSATSARPQQAMSDNAETSSSVKKQLQQLNKGLLDHLNKSSVSVDYSKVCEYYIAQARKITGEPAASQGASISKSTPAPPKAMFGGSFAEKPQSDATATPVSALAKKRSLDEAGDDDAPPHAKKTATNLFQSAQQTPKPSSALSRPPATEPSKLFGKRPADDEGETEAPGKRRRSNDAIEYPKLPENASNAAKLFEAALKKPTAEAAPTPAAKKSPVKAAAETPKPAAAGGFKPSASIGGFKPSMPTPAASSGGFKPSAPAGASNFMAAFGQNAQKAQADARKKAMDEDFDSEDDDKDEWEKNYEAEQAAKRAKIAEAAKAGSGFSFAAPAAPSSASTVFGGGAAAKSPAKPVEKEADKSPAKTAAAPTTGSLFSKSAFNPSTSLSSFSTKAADSEKNGDENKDPTTEEDHTWKQGTPIKFGGKSDSTTPAVPATAPPKGSSLFNNTSGSSLFSGAGNKSNPLFSSSTNGTAFGGGSSLFSNGSKPAQPSSGFSFSPSKSAAPANTEADKPEEAGGEDDGAMPAEAQVEDMTALQPAELEESEVLYYVEKAKSFKLDSKNEGDQKSWMEKGLGKIWLLKNKETGKTRILLKVAPFGKPAMNFNLLASGNYERQLKKVMGSFVDTVNEKAPKMPSRWYVAFGKEEDAKEMARILGEEAGKIE